MILTVQNIFFSKIYPRLKCAPWLLFFCCSSVHAQQPIKIGLVLPLSGTMAISSVSILPSVKLWLDETHATGGLLGRPFQLQILDPAIPFATSRRADQFKRLADEADVLI